MELRRADIGFGSVTIDDRGVARRGLIRSRRIAFDAIAEYRLELVWHSTEAELRAQLFGPLAPVLAARGRNGQRDVWAGVELVGGGPPIAFNWRFKDATAAIATIVRTVHPRLLANARFALDRDGHVSFGPLGLWRDGVRWAQEATLPAARVEAIELFDGGAVELRVMERDRVRPFGRVNLEAIPNVLVALAIAEQLGYAITGRELLGEITP